MSALFLLSALVTSVPTALPPDDGADGRCVVLLGYLGAHGAPEQASAAGTMIPFFLGRRSARHADSAIATIVSRAADEAKEAAVNAQGEGARCQAVFRASTSAFTGGLRTAIGQPNSAIPHTP